jgi:putative tricarboxylic transport membrane protein
MNGSTPGTGRRPVGAAFVIAAGLAGLGAILIRESGRIPDKGGYAGIGSGDMPLIIGWLLVGLAVWTAVAAWRGAFVPRPRQQPVPILWMVAGLGLQLVLLKPLGFTIASGLLFACTAAAFGKRNLALTLPVGALLALLVYGVFDRLLQLNLPAGPVENLIFGG